MRGPGRGCLILISGLPAAGKSTLAEALGHRFGARVLSRDQMRQQIQPRMRLVDRVQLRLFGRYPRRLQRAATRRLEATAAGEIAHGRTVIVEVIADAGIRRRLDLLAEAHGARLVAIEVTCGDAREHARRLGTRPGTWQPVLARTARSYQPATDALVIDTARTTPAQMIEQATRYANPPPG